MGWLNREKLKMAIEGSTLRLNDKLIAQRSIFLIREVMKGGVKAKEHSNEKRKYFSSCVSSYINLCWTNGLVGEIM